MTATTALTAQNTRGVRNVHVVPSEFVGEQIDACVEDVGVDVVKTGKKHQTKDWHSLLVLVRGLNAEERAVGVNMVG